LSRSSILGGRSVFTQHTLYGGCGDAMAFGDLAQALAMLAVAYYRGMVLTCSRKTLPVETGVLS
jgi:hypothetical protein